MPQDEDWHWDDDDAAAFTQLILRQTRPYGVIFLTPEGRIKGWNRGAAHLTGFGKSEVLGQSFSFLFTAEDRERKLDQHELDGAKKTGCVEDERWHLRKDGSSFWSSGMTLRVPAQGDQPVGLVKIMRDASHLRSRMRYLENIQQECREREAGRDVFVATIAHELRNPLTPLKTALGMLMQQEETEGRARNVLRMMDRQLGFLERLVEDLVDITRVKRGKLRMDYARTTLQDLLAEAVDSCRSAAERRGVSLNLLFPSVRLDVEVDSERLQQVVINLVNNGIKFTPAGGTVWVTATADHTHFLILVRDNGKGISGELLPQIFDVFTQAGDAGSRRGAGLGIGLSLVKEIVSLHQGTVEVRSEGEGKGAEFTVRIPLRAPDSLSREPPAEPNEAN
jgi:PAS domain S-box-containing protein